MFESRSSRANMKSEEASRKLEIELKEIKELLAKKEKEYEKTCETYRAELTSIKDEKNNLQVSFFFEILVTETFPSRRERTGFRKTSRI
jgi:hypothetical protein